MKRKLKIKGNLSTLPERTARTVRFLNLPPQSPVGINSTAPSFCIPTGVMAARERYVIHTPAKKPTTAALQAAELLILSAFWDTALSKFFCIVPPSSSILSLYKFKLIGGIQFLRTTPSSLSHSAKIGKGSPSSLEINAKPSRKGQRTWTEPSFLEKKKITPATQSLLPQEQHKPINSSSRTNTRWWLVLPRKEGETPA